MLVAAALVVANPSCTGVRSGGDKAGNEVAGSVVLELAIADYALGDAFAVADFVRRVEAHSGGEIEVKVAGSWGDWAPDADAQVVRAVAAGDADLGVVDSGTLDTVGLSAFEALSAPMLIDGFALADAVLDSDVPHRMLDALSSVGVTGLGLSFQALPHPLSTQRPLLAPKDWRGLSFGTRSSVLRERVIHTLGATPVEVFGPTLNEALDDGKIQGFAHGIYGYKSEFRVGMGKEVPDVAANVVLWPGFNVLFANPSMLGSLTDQERTWLQQASDEATAYSRSLGSEEERSMRQACARGARFAIASTGELNALHRALVPVYRWLEQDPQTAAFIQEIEDLKRTSPRGPTPAVPAGCAWSGD